MEAVQDKILKRAAEEHAAMLERDAAARAASESRAHQELFMLITFCGARFCPRTGRCVNHPRLSRED